MKKVLSILAGTILAVSAYSQAFWEYTSYAGAFAPTPANRWTDSWTNFDPQNATYAVATITLDTIISTNTTLTASNVYLLDDRFTYVDSAVTLTIEPGTVIRGTGRGALIFNRGAKIMAMGTASQPIVFTSAAPAGNRDYGDWAGVVICGAARNNIPTSPNALAEGGIGSVSLNRGLHGGTNDADNSGVMQYVRIEFAGQALGGSNSELNGLSMYSVGSQTVIDHIQVSYSGDDSFEWFGGSVDCKYLVAFRGWDDDFDTDNGYRGRVQFGYSVRDSRIADQSSSNGFESDNDASGSTRQPKTKAQFSNVTLIGPNWTGNPDSTNSLYRRALHLRRNTGISVYNSIFTGYPSSGAGLYLDARKTAANYCGDTLQFCGNLLVQMAAGKYYRLASNSDTLCITNAASLATLADAENNDTVLTTTALLLGSTFGNSLTDYDARPQASSPALNHSCWAWNTSFVGVEEDALLLGLSLYPNPSDGFTNLTFDASNDGDLNITILDLNGRVLRTINNLTYEAGKNTYVLDVQGMSTGVYIVNINMGATVNTQKLIIK
jgi:Secretion system C-terminal sorting domain